MVSENRKAELLAARWVARQDRGLLDREEAELRAWLGESTANKVAYLRLKASWDRTARLAALKHPGEFKLESVKSVWLRRSMLAIAAALVALLLGTGIVYRHIDRNQQIVYTAQTGKHPILSLAD